MLVEQTLLGASTLLAEGDEGPEALRAAVTSPGGTTAAGLARLESRGVRAAFLEAIDGRHRRVPGSWAVERQSPVLPVAVASSGSCSDSGRRPHAPRATRSARSASSLDSTVARPSPYAPARAGSE